MKILVFAHRPPPHHGQSYMVELLLRALGGDCRSRAGAVGGGEEGLAEGGEIECYHVDCRLSKDLQAIGRMQVGKLFLLIRYCLQAIWCRVRYGVRVLYYVPAAPLRSAVYRDWVVMVLLRPFFPKRIYHWHATGLMEWLEASARPWERWLTPRLLGKPDLSIVLGRFNLRDAEGVRSRRAEVVPNGIPDPCVDFAETVLPRRRARTAARAALNAGEAVRPELAEVGGGDVATFHALFLSLCSPEKGLFDAVEGVALARRRRGGGAVRIKLTVAGTFWDPRDETIFLERIGREDLNDGEPLVEYVGFVTGERKRALMVGSDCLCFPTYYPAEGLSLVLIEAMAFGLPVIATRWRALPELFPEGVKGLVDPKSPDQVAAALVRLAGAGEYDDWLRGHFLSRFTEGRHCENMKDAILSVGREG